jgi:hypothetical protein
VLELLLDVVLVDVDDALDDDDDVVEPLRVLDEAEVDDPEVDDPEVDDERDVADEGPVDVAPEELEDDPVEPLGPEEREADRVADVDSLSCVEPPPADPSAGPPQPNGARASATPAADERTRRIGDCTLIGRGRAKIISWQMRHLTAMAHGPLRSRPARPGHQHSSNF